MSVISTVLNEKQLLCCLFAKPDLIQEMKENHFVTQESRVLYEVICLLRAEKVPITVQHVVNEGNKLNRAITVEALNSVLATEHDPDSFRYYHTRLRKDWARWSIEHLVIKDILNVVTQRGELDTARLRGLSDTIQSHVAMIENQVSGLISPKELIDFYGGVLQQRADGEGFYESGDSALDQLMGSGMAPGEQTALTGDTSMGKSTVGLSWVNKQINKRIPSMLINSEMSKVSTMDRLFAQRNSLRMIDLNPKPGQSLEESILEIYERERTKFYKMDTFYMVDQPNLWIRDLKPLILDGQARIRASRTRMRSDHLICTIDLWSMLKDVSGGDPGAYEEGQNLTNELAKELGVHLINIIQLRRGSGERPTTLEGIQKLRPTRDRIKNSGAIAERSRNVFGVFREKYYAKMFFPELKEQIDLMDDIVEIQNLKQSQGDVGGILKYRHDEGMFKLTRILEEDIAANEAQRELVANLISVGRRRVPVNDSQERPQAAPPVSGT